MLKVQPIQQSSPYSCGPASLKMVLAYFGEKISEKELIKLTGARDGYGCDPDELVKTTNKLGYKAVYRQNSNLDEVKKYLKKDIPVIVNWFSPTILGHYSVVVDIDSQKITYVDPQFGKVKKMKLKEFLNRWFELDEYPPKDPSKFTLREIVVIEPK